MTPCSRGELGDELLLLLVLRLFIQLIQYVTVTTATENKSYFNTTLFTYYDYDDMYYVVVMNILRFFI